MDTSTNSPTSWQWHFGDGTTSTLQNPDHIYGQASTYTVTLDASNNAGTKAISQNLTVSPSATLSASFAFSPTSPAVGQLIRFTDTSTGSPTSWQWSFGDGSTSAVQNPSHTFTSATSYAVTLTVSNLSGSKSISQTITVIPALTASFTYSPTSPIVGQTIQFTDTSTGGPTSWQWDFGDGTSSTVQNPSHVYGSPGSYVLTLTVRTGSNLNSTNRTIVVTQTMTASFTFSPASPAVGQAVQFTDTSSGSPTSWQWNFGDGGTSASRNPSHSFGTAGPYSVTLTVANASGSKSTSQTVTVITALVASFAFSPASPAVGQAVQFTDTSSGSPTSWQWNFGDLSSSTVQNPSHAFTTAGSYTVTLTVTNASGSKSTNRTVTVVAGLTAAFTYSPASPAPSQAVQFTDASTGSVISWLWNFGDGATSTTKSPSHTFSSAGAYTVMLTVSDGTKSDSASRAITVAVAPPGYYVDGSNPSASDSNPGTEALPWKTIAKANRTLVAGDTVYIKGGTYSITGSAIDPVNTGTAGKIITFTSYNNDDVQIVGSGTSSMAVDLDSDSGIIRSYIKVQGLHFTSFMRHLWIRRGSHIEISHCSFIGFPANATLSDFQGTWSASYIYRQATYNWIHHCTFGDWGICEPYGTDVGVVFQVGLETSTTDKSQYNLIEDNEFYHGGHHVISFNGSKNVYRNNYCHNEPWYPIGAPVYSTRTMFQTGAPGDGCYNLVEGNRIGYGGPKNKAEIGGAGGTMAGAHNIWRNNVFLQIYTDAMWVTKYSGQTDVTGNHVYNNTYWHGGYGSAQRGISNWDSAYTHPICIAESDGSAVHDNVFKNNIFYQNSDLLGTSLSVISYNTHRAPTHQIISNNWLDNAGNPMFADISGIPDPMNKDQFDFTLQPSSPCINAGGPLTTITSASGSGTVFIVADAGYFMDGWGIPGVEGDRIQILGSLQQARIVNVNYDTNTITVDVTMSWTQGQGIALAYEGSAPDLGAFEYGRQAAPVIK